MGYDGSLCSNIPFMEMSENSTIIQGKSGIIVFIFLSSNSNYPRDNYPPGQLPVRATNPLITTHQDNCPPRTITPVGQLPLRAVTPIARTPTLTYNYQHRNVIGYNPNCTVSTDWELGQVC